MALFLNVNQWNIDMRMIRQMMLICCIVGVLVACEENITPINATAFGDFDTVYINEKVVSGIIVDDTTDVAYSFYMYGPVDESHYFAVYSGLNVDLDTLLAREDIRLMNDYCEVINFPYGTRIFTWTPTLELVEPGNTYVWITAVDFGDERYVDGNSVSPFHVRPARGGEES